MMITHMAIRRWGHTCKACVEYDPKREDGGGNQIVKLTYLSIVSYGSRIPSL
jgi:hypothetical protein